MKRLPLFLWVLAALPMAVAQEIPGITTHPAHQAVAPGSPVTLSVVASGSAPLAYQWTLNGTAIAGATQASYFVANTQLAQAGRYQVVVSNGGGAVHSAPAEVRLTGALWAMGSDEDGQLGIGARKYVTNPVPVSREVKKIAAGSTHSLILKVDGSLWGMGRNNFGQLGDGTSMDHSTPVQVAMGVTAITSGYEHSLFVTNDGTLWGMGLSFSSNFRPVQVATGVSAAVAGYRHSLFIKHDGTLWAVGSNESGQLGDGTTTDRMAPVQVASEVSAVAAGGGHSLFLKKDGTLWGMGRNFFGQLGNGTTSASTSPVQVTTGVSAIAAGGDHSLFVRVDGTLWSVGENTFGQLGDGSMSHRSIPAQVATGVRAIAASIGHSMFVKIDGTLWAMGANYTGQLGDGTTNSRSTPIQIATGVAGVATGNGGVARLLGHSLFVKTDGSLWAMGANEVGQLGLGTPRVRLSPVQVATGVSATSAGRSHSLFVQGDGALWAMGWNVSGQVGSGSSFWEPSPVRVATRTSEVAAGSIHSHFVQWDGTLWAMGKYFIDDRSVSNRVLPAQLSSAVSIIAAGGDHSLFVKPDGTLWAMGSNQAGQLGDGTTTDRALPVQVAMGVSAVAAGWSHSLFLKYDGTLWAMGYNGFGPLPGRTTPVQVATGVSVIAAGAYHILFIKNDSTLWAMGYNSQGQLGDGLMSDGITPVQVATGVSAVAAGDYHSLFVKTDGTLWAMGANAQGQLGDGTKTSRSTPVQVASGVSAVAAGGNHSFFIQSSGLGTAPVITTPPVGAVVAAGVPITLTAAATGSGPLDYRWQKDGVDLPGLRGPSLYLPYVQAVDAGAYRVVVTNSAGSVTSSAAALEVVTPPGITTHPAHEAVAPGSPVTLSVVATGTAPLTYQWTRNGTAIAGATQASYAMANTQLAQAGRYQVVVSNVAGTVYSAPAEVRLSGALWAMGSDEYGQLGIGARKHAPDPIPVARDVRKIAAGSSYSLMLKSDGTLWAMGKNNYGQLGDGTTTDRSIPTRVASEIRSVSAGAAHSLFLRHDGTLWAVGSNQYGQLGDGTVTTRITPIIVASGVEDISAGGMHSFFLKSDGTLWAMGSNQSGQLGDGTTTDRALPVQVASGVTRVSGGGGHSLFLKTDRTLWAMGANYYGQLGDGSTTARSSPVPVATGVRTCAAGSEQSFFVKEDGSLWAMGGNRSGELGDGTTINRSTPVHVGSGVDSVAERGQSLFVKGDGTLWAMGNHVYGATGGRTWTQNNFPLQVATGVSAVAAGGSHSLFLKSDGTVWAVGANEAGQLGDGTLIRQVSPVQVAPTASAVAAGGYHSLFVQGDGTLWAIGRNGSGQLGSGSSNREESPVRVATGVSMVAAGWLHSHFVQRDATLWATGIYQAGERSQSSRSLPAQVAFEVGAVAAGRFHTLFVQRDGTLWTLGSNQNGALGDGTTTDRPTPVQVATGVSAVAAGGSHSLFLKHDGSLWAMGANYSGQLGDGSFVSYRSSPVQVATGVSAIAAGHQHSLFIKADGSLWAVGGNDAGQLGDGFTVSRSTPIQVASGVSAVAAGHEHSLFLKNDGSLWAMGSNSQGQLGDGTMTSRITPVQVASGVTAVAAGESHSLFLQSPRIGTAPSVTIVAGASSVPHGEFVTLSAAATGSGPLDYRWQKDGVDLPGARGSTLYLPFFRAADAGLYRVIVTNSADSAFSAGLSLKVLDSAPVLRSPLTGATLGLGGGVVLTSPATGSLPLTYQWRRNGLDLPGATQASLALTNAQLHQAGDYSVRVTNPMGSVVSNAARLNVIPRVGSYSARLQVEEEGALATFVIEGTVPKKVLLRVVGPGLTPFGLSGLPDPRLEVFDRQGTLLAVNDNWGQAADAAGIAATTAAVGAFALGNNSNDAAVVLTLPAGAYAVRARPASGPGGVGYLELYDADLSTGPVSAVPYVAVRGRLGEGGGVVVGGMGPLNRGQRNYLIRAIGPGLGVPGALANPALQVVRGGTLVGQNDDWDANAGEAAAAVSAALRVGAFALPAGGRDAALALAGNLHVAPCTVQVGSAGATGGLVLLELHDADGARPEAFAPFVPSPPVATTAAAGGPLTLRVLAHGTAPLSYQWRKEGVPITGATAATYSLAAAEVTAGGSYTVMVANAQGSAVSLPALVTVQGSIGSSAATHAWVGPAGYQPGGTVTVTNTLTFSGLPTGLGWSVALPAGWTFVADGGAMADARPMAGDTGTLEWAWAAVPASPLIFTYTVRAPTGASGPQQLTPEAIVRFNGEILRPAVSPRSLSVELFVTHSADMDADYRIGLLELTRVIELYNTRNGVTRTGAYAVAPGGTEDGFAIDASRALSPVVSLTRYHSADSNRNARIDLLELTRVIELYNSRAGGIRTGRYRVQAGTEDGFAPGA